MGIPLIATFPHRPRIEIDGFQLHTRPELMGFFELPFCRSWSVEYRMSDI
jgi:hypothetical protein